MLKLFKPKYHSILGIDIGPTSVKAIEISGRDENRRVEGYGNEPLPPAAVDGHIIKDIDAVSHAIRRLLARTSLSAKTATLAVPDSAIISKILQVNNDLNESEIEEFIIMEADKYIPYPIEEISIDFEILGPSSKNAALLDVLIVASRSENVSSRVEASSKAGLQVQIVDVESFAVERAVHLLTKELPSQGQGKVVAVVDIGEEFSNLFMLHGLKLIYTREDEFGSKQLVNDIATFYGTTLAQAQQMKADNKLPEGYHDEVLRPFIETLLLHIKRALQFFFSASHYSFIDHILLAGGVATLPDLTNLVQERTSVPTTIANPMAHLRLADHIDQTQAYQDAPTMLIACGLALRALG